MKPSTIPLISSYLLTAMASAGLSHWWSARQVIATLETGHPVTTRPLQAPQPMPAAPVLPPKPPVVLAANPSPQAPAPTSAQKAFYEALIAKMEGIQNQNRDLLDQLAETNRDLMKLEFRVDTHSESFRPMPVSEDRPFTKVDDEPGVLPPRAEPVVFPIHE
jgi:hypothetical protein